MHNNFSQLFFLFYFLQQLAFLTRNAYTILTKDIKFATLLVYYDLAVV